MSEFNLLVVDDEELVRSAVTSMIDWSSLGFSEIYEAEDGQDALEICRTHKIDLVLTDIVMPFMDGMELSRILKEEFPQIHIVILTGHEEFEYANQCIHYGVKNYILKPIGAQSLYKEMKDICQGLNIESEQKQYIAQMRRQLHESIPILREKFLYSLVCTPYHAGEDQQQRIRSLEIPLYSQKYMVGMIEVDLTTVKQDDMELFLFVIKNICVDSIGIHHCVFDDGNHIVIVFNLERYGENYHSIAYDTMEVIVKAIQIALKLQSAGALGSEVTSLGELYQSYCEANTVLECRCSMGYDRIYDIGDLDYVEKYFLYPTEKIKKFIYSMKFLDEEKMQDVMNQICTESMGTKRLSSSNIKMIFFELLHEIIKELSMLKHVEDNLWEDGISLYRTMDTFSTVAQFSKGIMKFATDVAKALKKVQFHSSQLLIQTVKEYLESHYMEADLSLSTVAAHIGISTGYLSGLFKKETNRNFIEYLTEVRMEHAIALMRQTDKKSYEIAEETGFSNPHYFSLTFRKYSGMSPSAYRTGKEE